MGTALAIEPGSGRVTRRSRIVLLSLIIAAVSFVAPAGDANTLFASQIGTLDAVPAHTGLSATVTASVFDPDLNVTVLREFESTDRSDNPYVLPVGSLGDSTIYQLKNTMVARLYSAGEVTTEDLEISVSKAAVQWVNAASGTFALVHTQTVTLAENFTVTYRSEHNDTTQITLRSPSDPVGFTLTLRETTPVSHTFEATFETGSETSITGADDAELLHGAAIIGIVAGFSTVEYVAYGPVYEEVGITANRRREMRVGIKRQAEMTDVCRRVFRMRHGA